MKIVEPETGKRFARRNSRRIRQLVADLARAAAWHTTGRQRYSLEAATQMARDHYWCFIVGCNNSGTSLTQQILSRSNAASSFELEGQRYTRALARAVKRGHERVWTEYLDELRLTEQDALDPFPRLLHDWHLGLGKPLKPLILEKTTANIVRMRWLQHAFGNAQFIVLVRDGYAVTEGIYRKGEQDIARAARHWNRVYEIALEDAAYLDRLLFLKYEDLVSQQEQTAKQLAEFTGLPFDEIYAGFGAKYNLANPDARTGIKDFNASSKARLSAEDVQIIQQEAGSMLEHFGYQAA